MILLASRHAIEDFGRVQRVHFTLQIARCPQDEPQNERHDGDKRSKKHADAFQARHLFEETGVGMQYEDDCKRNRQENGRTRKGRERREKADERRNQHDMAQPEVLVRRTHLAVAHLVVLGNRPAPQRDGKSEKRGEVVSGHVGVAERRKEVSGHDHRFYPERTFRACRRLHDTEKAQKCAVPDDNLEQKALAASDQRMLHREHGRQSGEEPQADVEVVEPVHAVRQKRDRRLGVRALERDFRIVADWAKPFVEEGNQQKKQESYADPRQRIFSQRGPDACARLDGGLARVALREANHHFREKKEKPRDGGHQQIPARTAEKPGKRAHKRRDGQCGYVVIEKRHTSSPLPLHFVLKPCRPDALSRKGGTRPCRRRGRFPRSSPRPDR